MLYKERSFCGELSRADVGRRVLIAGWVDALRDHGEVLFIHLRERSGIIQVVFGPDHAPPEICERASTLKNEFCITVAGLVCCRAQGTENPLLETGRIEVMATGLDIISRSEALPFPITEKAMQAGAGTGSTDTVAEDIRLRYRYLDLRRPSMQHNLIQRHRINRSVRDFLDTRGFVEIETPMLTKSTPEGARDYLVPSRIHAGHFYALPQSPQLFKQLLMISGFERYFQIVRCFRDEDLRPNRQPEFTQLDIEASFIDESFFYELIEELTVRMFALGGITLPRPFPRMPYREAMDTMGSDRPDTRFGLRFVDATDIFTNTNYGIFRQIIQRGGRIKGFNVKGQSERLSKNVLQNEYAKEIVPGFGAKGMTWMRVSDGTLESNIVQFFSGEEQQALSHRFDVQSGDVIVMIADASYELVVSTLGQLRLHMANRLGLIPEDLYSPLWVTDFPLFEPSEDGIKSSHHPFTAPDRTDFDTRNRDELLSLHSRAYDLVINGEELGGGSIRINDRSLQRKIFEALGLSGEEVEEKFGFFLRALDYGPPPHGGIALGMDRVVSMILNTPSIREVIAFPKNRSAYCPLTQAPSRVSEEQLKELELLNVDKMTPLPGMAAQSSLVESLSWVSRVGIQEGEHTIITAALEEARQLARLMNESSGQEEPLFSVVSDRTQVRSGETPRQSPLSETSALLRNAPAVKGSYFKVASVLE